jgi:hypothetical protein
MEKDKSYFMRRAAQEHTAAEGSSGDAARGAHEELERRYRELAGAKPIAEKPPS